MAKTMDERRAADYKKDKKPAKKNRKAEQGMFNFGSIMNDFYNSKPEAGTDQALMKSAFQGNMIQSALDSQLAQQLGAFNAGLAQTNMRAQADLEQRNQAALMKDEFNYGMQQMDACLLYTSPSPRD